MVKMNTYQGKTPQELENISLEDALPMLSSRARRAAKRAMKYPNSKYKKLVMNVRKIKEKGDKGKVIKKGGE